MRKLYEREITLAQVCVLIRSRKRKREFPTHFAKAVVDCGVRRRASFRVMYTSRRR